MRHLIARIPHWITRLLPVPRGRHLRGSVPLVARQPPRAQRRHQDADLRPSTACPEHRNGEFDELAALTRQLLAIRERR